MLTKFEIKENIKVYESLIKCIKKEKEAGKLTSEEYRKAYKNYSARLHEYKVKYEDFGKSPKEKKIKPRK